MLARLLDVLLPAEEFRAPQDGLFDQGDVYLVGRLRVLDARLHNGIIVVAGVSAGKDDDQLIVEGSSKSGFARYPDPDRGVANVGY